MATKTKQKQLHLLVIQTLTLLALCVSQATAQSVKSRALDIQLGYGLLARQDLVFSPFVSRGGSPVNVKLSYRRRRHWEQDWSLQFTQISAQHRPAFDYVLPEQPDEVQAGFPHSFSFADLDYTLGKALARRGRSEWALFGALAADIDVLYYNHARISNFGYFIAFDLAAGGRWRYQLAARHRIEAELRLPLLAWVARSPYLINDDDFIQNTASHSTLQTLMDFIADGRIATPQHYQRLALQAGYDIALRRGWHAGVVYRGEMLRYTQPLALNSIQHQAALKLSLHF